jgi:hypothetical protein
MERGAFTQLIFQVVDPWGFQVHPETNFTGVMFSMPQWYIGNYVLSDI